MNSLYRNADVVVESWVELRESVTTTYEVDREDQFATLYFGTRNAFVLHVNRDNLAQLVELGGRALTEFGEPNAEAS